jgi:PAS domain S-box-containing protein
MLMASIRQESLVEVFEQVPDPWWLIDLETSRFMAANQASVDQLGFSREEIGQIGVIDVNRAIPSAAHWRQIASSIQRGQTRRFLSELQCKNGSLVPVEVTFARVTLGDGEALLAFTRDLSKVAAIESQLRDQERLFRKLSAQVPGVIYQLSHALDGSMVFDYASEAARAIFGLEAASDGRPIELSALVERIHPEDRAAFVDAIEQSRVALAPLHQEFRILHAGGAVEWLETRAVPERSADGSTGWYGFTSVVTERKAVELELRRSRDLWDMAAVATGLGIVQFDNETTSLTLDHRARLMHTVGSSRSPRLTLDHWLVLIHPDDRAATATEVGKARDLREPLVVRYRLAAADPANTTIELSAHWGASEPRQPAQIVGTCRDVTGQVSAESLRRDKESAERASRAKSEFLSRVSHELRTPLNGILGFAQLMMLDDANVLSELQRTRLRTLQMAGSQLLALINDMLDIARIEREEFALDCGPVDVSSVAQSCVSLIQPLAASADVLLPEVPLRPMLVVANARALGQVLTNLFSNAVKYNRPGGRVLLTTDADADRLLISVSDEGQGMTETQQAHLFQPFNRLGAERGSIPGSGLGLVIARELTRAMGGELSVQSRANEGTTFTISLPQPHAAEEILRELSESKLQTLSTDLADVVADSPRSVLYIEDEAVNVLLMEEVFRLRPNWTLTVARTGAEGLKQVLDKQPDLVLIDMNLPDMNGLQVLAALREMNSPRHIPCVALSADALCEQVDAALHAGFDEYWTKPIDVCRVLADFSRALATEYFMPSSV